MNKILVDNRQNPILARFREGSVNSHSLGNFPDKGIEQTSEKSSPKKKKSKKGNRNSFDINKSLDSRSPLNSNKSSGGNRGNDNFSAEANSNK